MHSNNNSNDLTSQSTNEFTSKYIWNNTTTFFVSFVLVLASINHSSIHRIKFNIIVSVSVTLFLDSLSSSTFLLMRLLLVLRSVALYRQPRSMIVFLTTACVVQINNNAILIDYYSSSIKGSRKRKKQKKSQTDRYQHRYPYNRSRLAQTNRLHWIRLDWIGLDKIRLNRIRHV